MTVKSRSPASVCAQDSDLLEGWAAVTLSQVCEVNPPKPPKDAFPANALVSFVPMPAVDADSGTIVGTERRPYSRVRTGYTSFRDRDVIVAKITPCMENGKAAVAAGLANGLGFGSTEFHVLRSNGAALPEFVFHFVRQESFRQEAKLHMSGNVGQQRVPVAFIAGAEFPLPPLAEQKRIVAKVEALLTRLNAARERLAKVPTFLKRFRQAVLAAACSGRLTADWRDAHKVEDAAVAVARLRAARPSSAELDAEFPVKRWRVREMGELASELLPDIPESWVWVHLPELGYMNRGRSRNRPRNAPRLYGGPHPFIQTGDIAQSGGRIRHHRQTYSDEGLAQSRLWPAGTICITIAANIADSAMLTYPACFPDSVVGLLPDPELCLAEYAEFFIRTAREDLSQFAPATAQKNINIAILEEVAVPLPPLPEQREIVRRVEALFKLADSVEKRVAVATKRTEKLTQSILAKAFRGELVPTEAELARREGRDYEPASVLLVRIRSERSKQAGVARPHSRRLARARRKP